MNSPNRTPHNRWLSSVKDAKAISWKRIVPSVTILEQLDIHMQKTPMFLFLFRNFINIFLFQCPDLSLLSSLTCFLCLIFGSFKWLVRSNVVGPALSQRTILTGLFCRSQKSQSVRHRIGNVLFSLSGVATSESALPQFSTQFWHLLDPKETWRSSGQTVCSSSCSWALTEVHIFAHPVLPSPPPLGSLPTHWDSGSETGRPWGSFLFSSLNLTKLVLQRGSSSDSYLGSSLPKPFYEKADLAVVFPFWRQSLTM